jgi:hypothetical protein
MLLHRHQGDQPLAEVNTSSETPAVAVAIAIGGAGIGGAGIVVGFYALIRAGINTNDFSRPAVTVLTIEHTPLLAIAEVGFGALMVLAAMTPRFGRIMIGLLSATLVAFGAALLYAPRTNRLHHWFGVVHHQGWSFVATGTTGLIATLTIPTIIRHTIVRSEPAAQPDTRDADLALQTVLASADMVISAPTQGRGK